MRPLSPTSCRASCLTSLWILARNLKRLGDDWNAIYGHPLLLAETFVDRARFLDRSQIRKRNGAPVMATLRNLALMVIRLTGVQTIAKALRHCSRRLGDALRLLGLS